MPEPAPRPPTRPSRPALLAITLGLALALPACDGARGGAEGGGDGKTAEGGLPAEICRIQGDAVPLAAEVRESSGVAASRRHDGVFWTHGDSGAPPELFAVRADGSLAGRVKVAGATNRDWEDVALAPCPGGGDCLYLADTGDNYVKRDAVTVWRVPEPDPGAAESAPAEALRARFPGVRRDVEALFVLPGGHIHLVTKGGPDHPVELFRFPASPATAGDSVPALERVREVFPRPEQPGDLVTSAGASPDGRWVALRTYGSLHLFRAADLLGGGGPAHTVDLAPLVEAQGEGVAMAEGGAVVLTSEGASRRKLPGTISRIACELP